MKILADSIEQCTIPEAIYEIYSKYNVSMEIAEAAALQIVMFGDDFDVGE